MSLSKDEKRKLKKGYKDALKNQVVDVCVISDSLTPDKLDSRLLNEYRAIKLDPAVSQVEGAQHEFLVSQRTNAENHVHIAVRRVDEDLIDLLLQREKLMDADVRDLHGLGVAVLSSQAQLSEVNDLLLSATVRVFGRLFHGHFANADAVMDDWLSWSLDYMGPTMAEVSRVYDAESPNFETVLRNNPDLIYKKPWWRVGKA
ncbi:MAG: hypothetical protein ACSHX6_07450 [Akkermansiaceae bacterium]